MRARAYVMVVACVVLVGLVAGCGDQTGTVRRGQTGEFIAPDPGPSGEGLRFATPPLLYLKVENVEPYDLSSFRRLGLPITPITVTEHSADEEFWEFAYRWPTAATGGTADRPLFVIGARTKCEVMRNDHERNGIRTGPCLGPHYFKRTGPPEVVRRPGYNP